MKLLHNVRIYTLDESQPTASALVIDTHGQIVALGGEELLESFPSAQREEIGRASCRERV